ncbi:MAG: hypothetical protein R3B94_04805 [Hyphomonas sp.]
MSTRKLAIGGVSILFALVATLVGPSIFRISSNYLKAAEARSEAAVQAAKAAEVAANAQRVDADRGRQIAETKAELIDTITNSSASPSFSTEKTIENAVNFYGQPIDLDTPFGSLEYAVLDPLRERLHQDKKSEPEVLRHIECLEAAFQRIASEAGNDEAVWVLFANENDQMRACGISQARLYAIYSMFNRWALDSRGGLKFGIVGYE